MSSAFKALLLSGLVRPEHKCSLNLRIYKKIGQIPIESYFIIYATNISTKEEFFL